VSGFTVTLCITLAAPADAATDGDEETPPPTRAAKRPEADPARKLPEADPGRDITEAGPARQLPEADLGRDITEAGPVRKLPETDPGRGITEAGPVHQLPEADRGRGIPGTGSDRRRPAQDLDRSIPEAWSDRPAEPDQHIALPEAFGFHELSVFHKPLPSGEAADLLEADNFHETADLLEADDLHEEPLGLVDIARSVRFGTKVLIGMRPSSGPRAERGFADGVTAPPNPFRMKRTEIAKLVTDYRKKHCMSRRSLGVLAGVSDNTVRNVERCRSCLPATVDSILWAMGFRPAS
jgi:hypothetical protein